MSLNKNDISDSNTNSIQNHLKKFDDLDVFFEDTKEIVQYYYDTQKKYKDINDFKNDLTSMIKFYIERFDGNRRKRKKFKPLVHFIQNKYYRLIFVGEENYQANFNKQYDMNEDIHLLISLIKGGFEGVLEN